MSIDFTTFGCLEDDLPVKKYTLINALGASVSILDYGLIITSIKVPDKDGFLSDVALGFDSLDRYLAKHDCMGDTIGRFANRISKGTFQIDGVTYHVSLNEGCNHNHGGFRGFSSHLWDAVIIEEHRIVFHRISPDGEEGFPGTLDISVAFTWSDACELTINYTATTDRPTLCNLTNHTYFNLAGHNHGTIEDHWLQIDADYVLATNHQLIPSGDFVPVAQTPLDFNKSKRIGDGLQQRHTCPSMIVPDGYDNCYLLRKKDTYGIAATLVHKPSGRMLEVFTDYPAMQLFSSCGTNFTNCKDGANYGKYAAVCFETQFCPDAPNHPNFPGSAILRPSETFSKTTVFTFRTNA